MDEKYSSLKYLAASSRAVSALEEEDPRCRHKKKQFHQDTVAKAVYQMKAVAQNKIPSIAPELLLSLSQKVSTDFAAGHHVVGPSGLFGSYSDTLATFTVIRQRTGNGFNGNTIWARKENTFFVKK
jgi:hypothetical protein